MSKIVVGVLRGGPSSEYEVSLKSGSAVLKNLPEKYKPVDVFISKDGAWHLHGVERAPQKALSGIDVVFNSMHGEYGEDGKVQKLLDSLNMPYTGSGALQSALGMNKHLSKSVFKKRGLKVAPHIILTEDDFSHEKVLHIFRTFPQPSIVKPVMLGSSVGVSIARGIASLEEAIKKALELSEKVMIEEYIKGREATCGVVENFRGQKNYSLLPIEIIKPAENDFFDYEAKYGGGSKEICPGRFSRSESAEIERMARLAHEALGLRHYSRSDFIISPKRGIFILESNSQPGLTEQSLIPKSLEAVGCSFPHFLDHLVTLALSRR